MKDEYIKPILNIIVFENKDVITTSGEYQEGDNETGIKPLGLTPQLD